MIVVLATFSSKDKAQSIGRGLLVERLIACYNLSPVGSAYWWKGEIVDKQETMVVMKTAEHNFNAIEAYVTEHSDYDVTELIALEPKKVNKAYGDWVDEESKGVKV